MLITEKRFYEEALNLSIPEMKEASELYKSGDTKAAAKKFADYVRNIPAPEKFLSDRAEIAATCKQKGETTMDIANRVVENRYVSVGVAHDFGKDNKIDWYANPCYNNYVEWGYQFHRHNEWTALAHAYLDTGDEKYAEYFAKTIYSWITEAEQYPVENPSPYACKHWRTIECGIRMTRNWHTPIFACLKSPAISDELWVLIFMSIWEHGNRLYNDNTYVNWLSLEMNGLLHVGVFYPFLADAEKWKNYALNQFIEETDNQFYADNLQAELTTGYHGVVLSNFTNVLDFLNVMNIEPPEALMKGIRKMFRMYEQLAEPDFVTPALNDGGRASAAQMCRKGLSIFPDDEILKFFATEGKEGKAPDYKTHIMPYAGMIAMRTGWDADATWGFFESAPFGAAHAHEDKLNFLLYAYRTEMLPDSGNFRYDSSNMRRYVIKTRSHNTGLVDGLPQNRSASAKQTFKMVNGRRKIVTDELRVKSNLRAKIGEDIEVAEGTYDEGYGINLVQVIHKRKVIFFKKGLANSLPFFVLIDKYVSNDENEHVFETSFQLPTVPVSAFNNKVTAKYETGAELNFISSVNPKIYIGQYTPEYMGWRPDHTPEVKEHFPAPVLSFSEKAKEASIVTVLYPSPDSECPISNVSADDAGFTITVNGAVEYFGYSDESIAALDL